MKLRDVITALDGCLRWLRFDCEYDIVGGNIVPTLACNVDVNLDSEVEIVYQWYHHCHPDLDIAEISKAINNHDYETFLKWYNTFEDEPWTYLPHDAYIHIGNECIGTVCIAYDQKLFNLITWEDHECG